jgi:hypothetical protein
MSNEAIPQNFSALNEERRMLSRLRDRSRDYREAPWVAPEYSYA